MSFNKRQPLIIERPAMDILAITSNVNSEQQQPLDKDGEGLNLAYNLGWRACFLGQRAFKDNHRLVAKSISAFEDLLHTLSNTPWCMSIEELNTKRLLKRKHYHYAAHLAVLSSVPILSSIAGQDALLDAIVAKMCAIVSIKTLDNVNDTWHTHEDIVRSLDNQLAAFSGEPFEIYASDATVRRAENYTFHLARNCYDILSKYRRQGARFSTKYVKDLNKYVKGQTDSMLQKRVRDGQWKNRVDIKRFLRDVNEKSVGKIWIDSDFCIAEGLRDLSTSETQALELIGQATDYVFKGCNVYDDVADLEIDLRAGILNSVVYLALDRGLCSKSDLLDPEQILHKIRAREGIKQSIQLGDWIYLKSYEYLNLAGELTDLFDIGALERGLKVLRLFAMRKWLFRQTNPLTVLPVIMRPTRQHDFKSYETYI
jgi:hypothetical protein